MDTAPDRSPAKSAIGPFGERITLGILPQRAPRRWVRRRKLELAAAVLGGLISRKKAMERFGLTADEIESWIGELEEQIADL